MNIYNYAGQDFTEDQIEKRATSKGLSLQEYLNKNPEITLMSGKEQGLTGDPTMSQNNMGSQLADGSLEQPLPEDDTSVGGWFKDMYTAIKGGAAAGGSVGEAFDVYRQGRNISEEDLQGFIEAAKAMENNPETNEAASWRQDTEKHGGGALGGFMSLLENPGYFPQFIASSMSTMASSLFDSEEVAAATGVGAAGGAVVGSKIGGLAGTVGGPIGNFLGYIGGAGAGAMGGGMAGLVGAMETGLTLTDLLRDELGEKDFNEKNVRALLNDKDVMDRVKSKSLARGATIGMVEGLTFGLSRGVGGKMLGAAMAKGTVGLSKAGLKTGAKIAGATTAIEMTGGAGGETLGMLAAGQELKGEEIFLEAIGEAKGAVNTSDFVKAAITKSSYKLNKEEVTAAKIKEIIDNPNTSQADLAKMNIDVTGDKAFDAYVKKKQGDAAIDTQIDARITDKADRKKLVDLEIKRNKAKADVKKEGSFKVLNADQALLDVETEIETLLNKYEGAVGFGETTEAKDVKKVVAEKVFQSNMEFAKKHSELYGLKFTELTQAQIKEKFKGTKNADLANSLGGIIGDEIIINKDLAKTRVYGDNVGNHELLHGIIKASGQLKNITQETIDDFLNVIGKDNATKIQERLDKNYSQEYIAENLDEYFTAFSDAIANKEIAFNDSVFTKMADVIRRMFASIGLAKVDFESGRGAYNFLKDYNKSIHKGSLSSGVVRVTKGDGTSETLKTSKSGFDQAEVIEDLGLKDATAGIVARNTEIENTILEEGVKDEEGNIKASPAQQRKLAENNLPRAFALAKQAAGRAKDLTLDDALKIDDVMEFYGEYALKLTELSRTYKAQMTDPKTGKIVKVPFGAYMNSLLPLKYSGILDKLKSKIQTTSISDETVAKKVGGIADKTPKPTEQASKGPKARKLTSLADIDVDRNPLIKEATKVELKRLIESNPKNLTEKIQEVLIPDLVEIIRQEMGVIGQKDGKLNIPDTYLVYLADSYTKTISSMEIEKIRANYKNLFKKEKMGFADYKTKKSNKPSLKKDSNYRKDIFKNITNKALFTKYHTEGKKNKLIANQRNLAIMRAEAEAVRASENYIIENSKNLNEVYGAELRNFIDSNTTQKQLEENKSFDSVKYSKSMALAAFEIREAVLTGNNVFDNNGNLVGSYKNILKNKKDSKAVGNFVWGNLHLLSPETDFRFLVKAYEKLYSKDRGTEYETNLIQTAIKAEKIYGIDAIEVVLRKPTEKDALPDMILKIHGVTMNVEAKMSLAQYSSVTNSIVDGNMVVEKQYSAELMKILAELQEESQKGIKKAKKFLKENGIEWDGIRLLSTEAHNMLKNNYDMDTRKSVFNGMSATLPLPLKFISEIYNNKKHPVFLMQLMGRGLFSMGSDKFNLGIPALEDGGDGFITLRISSNSQYRVATQADVNSKLVKSIYTDNTNTKKKGEKKTKRQVKTGMKTYSYRSIPGISDNVLNDMKSTQNIENLAGVMKLMDSKEIADIKTQQEAKNKQEFYGAVKASRSINKKSKGITVLDFDDTLATTKSLVKFTRPDGTTGTLNAEEYASTYENLLDKGFTFDFSDFNKVVKGKIAPLFQKAIKLQGKFGPENMFVLTARPPQAAKAIFDFLKANGLNIPIKNITGLGNSTAEAKALWVADKVGEGFNDFYFADDALQNTQAVQNMLDQFDVKSKVQQAKVKFSKSMNDQFNDILENVTGIDSEKRFGAIKGRKRGEDKGKFRFFVPPSHEDFVGLLYNFLGKGRVGDKHRNFFEQALVRPLNRANREYDTARQSIANDYKNLAKRFPKAAKALTKKTPDGDFTYQDAVRVYLWNKHGHTIPGLSPIDQKKLVELVDSMPGLKSYAENVNIISKQKAYVKPTEGWNSGDIRTDLDDATGRIGRKEFFSEFIENAEVIFSEENLNKIEAGYGKGVRESLEDMLYRIKTGRNRPTGQNEQVNKLMNYLNGSVGTVMFFNMRSALLQQMSIVNYINFADNNLFAAAKAFANQKQYWADWAFIFNSDMLKQRRGGIQTDVNGAELAASLRNSKDTTRKLISKLLELGFLPTQIGDNIAIATGGASYYRNRINTYLKQGLSQKEAESKAFTDFQDITQSTQQSARPDMVSKQQASVIGKVILNFQNVTSQFNRLGKKAFQDIYNRRITKPNTTQMQSDISNASRITYYFAIQNMIFYTLQTALFAMMFSDDEEDDNKLFLKKKERLINGSIDSVLRGTGLIGGVVATLKNVAIAFARQRDVKYNPDESAVALEALNLSPVLGIKMRKIVNAEKTLNYNKKVIDEMSNFDIDNPQWSAVTNYTEALTNVPLNRLYNKTQNVRQALNNEHSAWERSLMFLGWSQYNLDLENKKMEDIKEKAKGKKKIKSKTKKRRTVINR